MCGPLGQFTVRFSTSMRKKAECEVLYVKKMCVLFHFIVWKLPHFEEEKFPTSGENILDVPTSPLK
jgi:hypothetical protein